MGREREREKTGLLFFLSESSEIFCAKTTRQLCRRIRVFRRGWREGAGRSLPVICEEYAACRRDRREWSNLNPFYLTKRPSPIKKKREIKMNHEINQPKESKKKISFFLFFFFKIKLLEPK